MDFKTYQEKLKTYLGDNTDDAALGLVEGLADLEDSYSENWKSKYENNDAEWRKKYRDRFWNGDNAGSGPDANAAGGTGAGFSIAQTEEPDTTPHTYADLFKTE